MVIFVSVFLFIVGLIIGSFLNVVIIRGERGEGLGGRSRCVSCRRTLGWKELIPVASFLFQRGRCRRCKKPISLQYPLVELATALVFAGIGASMNADLLIYRDLAVLVVACAVAAATIVILVSDIRFQIIPDGATAVLAIAGLVFSLMRGAFVPDITVAVVFGVLFFLLWFASRGQWMGFGDVKLVAATSLLVGFPASIAAILFAFWIGGVVGVALLATGQKRLGSRIPFGPFLLAGAGAAWLWGSAFLAFTGLGLMLY